MVEARENKYIIAAKLFPIIFPGNLEHALVIQSDKLTSAGFCRIDAEGARAHGKSVSLKLTRAEDDDRAIQAMIWNLDPFKYVIVGDGYPILLHPAFQHKQVAHNYTVKSAGKCRIRFNGEEIKVQTFDGSISTGKESQPEDAEHIRFLLQSRMNFC